MWIGGKLYFDSDRNGEFNLHSFDPATGEVQQLTSYPDFPVVNANAGDGKIIFEQAGHLRVFDPATVEHADAARRRRFGPARNAAAPRE